MADVQIKLLAALPAELRSTAERMRSRFHLDVPAWFSEADQPANLPVIAGACGNGTRCRFAIRVGKPKSFAASNRSSSC